tara:strand:- start:1894 stop:2091 length:198 start_codon:yes stop_codon:yes gene_type:complete
MEELGSLERNVGRGWGTTHPYVKGSDRPMLGNVEGEDAGDVSDQSPVKVSRAFMVAQQIDDPAES